MRNSHSLTPKELRTHSQLKPFEVISLSTSPRSVCNVPTTCLLTKITQILQETLPLLWRLGSTISLPRGSHIPQSEKHEAYNLQFAKMNLTCKKQVVHWKGKFPTQKTCMFSMFFTITPFNLRQLSHLWDWRAIHRILCQMTQPVVFGSRSYLGCTKLLELLFHTTFKLFVQTLYIQVHLQNPRNSCVSQMKFL